MTTRDPAQGFGERSVARRARAAFELSGASVVIGGRVGVRVGE
jgi:hypothetical protein